MSSGSGGGGSGTTTSSSRPSAIDRILSRKRRGGGGGGTGGGSNNNNSHNNHNQNIRRPAASAAAAAAAAAAASMPSVPPSSGAGAGGRMMMTRRPCPPGGGGGGGAASRAVRGGGGSVRKARKAGSSTAAAATTATNRRSNNGRRRPSSSSASSSQNDAARRVQQAHAAVTAVSVGTGSRRARALQQLAAKRSGASRAAAAAAASGRAKVDGTGGTARTATAPAAPRSTGAVAAAAAAATAAVTPGFETPAAAALPALHPHSDGRSGRWRQRQQQRQQSGSRIPTCGTSVRIAFDLGAAVQAFLNLEISSPCPAAGQSSFGPGDTSRSSLTAHPTAGLIELEPVRLVALPPSASGRFDSCSIPSHSSAAAAAAAAATASLPSFLGGIDEDQGQFTERTGITDKMVADVVRRSDASSCLLQAAAGASGASGASGRDVTGKSKNNNADTMSMSMSMSVETVNVVLLALGAGMLLKEKALGGGGGGGGYGGTDDNNNNVSVGCRRCHYYVYQPTSLDGAALFAVPATGPPTTTSTTRPTTTPPGACAGAGDQQPRQMMTGLERIGAFGREQGSALSSSFTSDVDDEIKTVRQEKDMVMDESVHSDEADDEELGVPRKEEPTATGQEDMDDDNKDGHKTDALPPPISLSELVRAYETCLGTGEPAPHDIATDLLPRYLASEEAQAQAQAMTQSSSVYDLLRSEEMIPSKDKVIFEVRDGLASGGAEREGLVRLVSVQVIVRLALFAHGGDVYLTWYHDAFSDDESPSSNSRKKKKKRSKKKSAEGRKSPAGTCSNPLDFFNQDVTALLSCVQFALPTTQTFSDFLKDIVAAPFTTSLSDTVATLYEYFEFDMPNLDQDGGEKEEDADSFSNVMTPAADTSLQSETERKGSSFPLLEESLKSDNDGKVEDIDSNADEKPEAKDPDSPLFRRSVDISRKSSNPLLADGKTTYVGSHFSNKLTNMSDLFREVSVPAASKAATSSKKRPKREASSSSGSARKRQKSNAAVANNRENAPNLPAQEEICRPFAAKARTKTGSSIVRSSSIVKETPMRPSRRRKAIDPLSPTPYYSGTPARQPQRHPAHLVAEAALAARKKK